MIGCYVYMTQDRNSTYYSGYTKDLNNRLDLHARGNGAKYLRGRSPLKLVFYKEYKYFKNALVAEQRLKRLTRKHKQQLVRIFEAKLSTQRGVSGAPADVTLSSATSKRGGSRAMFGETIL